METARKDTLEQLEKFKYGIYIPPDIELILIFLGVIMVFWF